MMKENVAYPWSKKNVCIRKLRCDITKQETVNVLSPITPLLKLKTKVAQKYIFITPSLNLFIGGSNLSYPI